MGWGRSYGTTLLGWRFLALLKQLTLGGVMEEGRKLGTKKAKTYGSSSFRRWES